MNEDHDCCSCCHQAPGVYLRKMGRLGADANGVKVETLIDLVCADCLPSKGLLR